MRLPNLQSGSPVAVDIETTGGLHQDPPENARVAVVSLAWQVGGSDGFGGGQDPGPPRRFPWIDSIALPFAFSAAKGDQAAFAWDGDINLPDEDWNVLAGWLRQHRLIFHNAKFDLGHLWTGTPRMKGFDLTLALEWDTAISSRDLDTGFDASLEAVEKRLGDRKSVV